MTASVPEKEGRQTLDHWLKKTSGRRRPDPRDVGPPAPKKSGVKEATRQRVRRLAAYQIPVREIAREVRVSASRVDQILEEEGIDLRERKHPLLSFEEATRKARELGGFARRKTVKGRTYFYAVKNEWIPATETRKATIRQRSLAYLGGARSP